MIAPEHALLGRQQGPSVADRNVVLGTPMQRPFPDGFDNWSSPWAASGVSCPTGLNTSSPAT